MLRDGEAREALVGAPTAVRPALRAGQMEPPAVQYKMLIDASVRFALQLLGFVPYYAKRCRSFALLEMGTVSRA